MKIEAVPKRIPAAIPSVKASFLVLTAIGKTFWSSKSIGFVIGEFHLLI
jgi:hypothetical protein